jgi:natural product precursor
MKLESLQLDKFQEKALKKEQMFKLNGGKNTVTAGGSGCGTGTSASNPNVNLQYDFGYDVNRDGYITYHDRTNVQIVGSCPP